MKRGTAINSKVAAMKWPLKLRLGERRSSAWLFGALIIVGSSCPPAYGEVTIKQDSISIGASISGTITKADAVEIARREKDFAFSSFFVVDLDSNGGDLDAAMTIGRIVRRNNGRVIVKTKCFSSCSLIYIAGVQRHVSGVVGLHRPYFASAPQSRQSLEKEMPLMFQNLRDYVHEMGIQDRFYQVMLNTEPSKMRLYGSPLDGHSDIENLVPSLDPIFDEVEISYAARAHGISTSEMRSRKAKSDQHCSVYASDLAQRFGCENAIEWGLDRTVYENRNAQVQAACFADKKGYEELNLIKAAARPDHPIYLKREACVRDLMMAR